MIYVSFDIGIKNLALCILEEVDDVVSIIDWKVITLSNTKKEIKGINDISARIYNELDEIILNLNNIGYEKINKVIIENQPSNLNGIMKTVQHLIFSYFNLSKHWFNNVDEVILINPSLKLQNHSYVPSSNVNKDSTQKILKKDRYKKNKTDAIEVCKYYIKDDSELLGFFNSHKKKDDLADTCLQVISYIRKNENLIEKIIINDKNIINTP